MSFNLSIKNIKKSFKDYTIYFLTLVFGVAIFYIFNSMNAQQAMMELSEFKDQLFDLMNQSIGALSIFISFILGFLIVYANNFLIKRRKKEFGIYMTLGMGKGKISKILLIETLLIGMISLIVGLFIGIFGSQLMSVLVAKLFEADMNDYTFIFSKAALIKTIIYFGVIYLFVMIFNTFAISKCKLITLLNANKKTEKIKVKNPVVAIILFILSCLTLGFAYYLVLGKPEVLSQKALLIAILCGIIGTVLFFVSLSGFILKLVQARPKIYLKNLNMFVLRQIHSKINTTTISMSIICILLFLTICIFSSALSLNNIMKKDLINLTPVDFTAYKTRNINEEKVEFTYSKEQIEDSYLTIKETIENHFGNMDELFKEYVEINAYVDPNYTFGDFFTPIKEEVTEKFPYLRYETPELLIKVSEYNKVAKLYGKEEYCLNDDEFIMICDFDQIKVLRDNAIKQNTVVNLNGKMYHSKYNECKSEFIQIAANHMNSGILIVPDNAITENQEIEKSYLNARYNATTKEEYEKIEKHLTESSNHSQKNMSTIGAISKTIIYDSSTGLSAVVTFIGLYLGIVFLITSSVTLALKELSDSSDNKQRYDILRKIGTDEKMIYKALLIQIGIFFLVPLLLAIIHSIVGIKFAGFILSTFGKSDILPSIIMTAIFLVAIYGGYFIATYFCSKSIIKEDIL